MRHVLLLSSGLHALALATLLALPLAPLTEPEQPASIEVLFGTGALPPVAAPQVPIAGDRPDVAARQAAVGAPAASPAPPVPPAAAAEPAPGVRVDRPDPTLIPARADAGNRGPAYPRAAWLRRQQGTVLLRLEIGPDGGVTRVETLRSSGVAELDAAAMRALAAWRFRPAERGGQPVASYRDQPVSFVLQ